MRLNAEREGRFWISDLTAHFPLLKNPCVPSYRPVCFRLFDTFKLLSQTLSYERIHSP